MISGRSPPLTAIAKIFNVLGLVYVTLLGASCALLTALVAGLLQQQQRERRPHGTQRLAAVAPPDPAEKGWRRI